MKQPCSVVGHDPELQYMWKKQLLFQSLVDCLFFKKKNPFNTLFDLNWKNSNINSVVLQGPLL